MENAIKELTEAMAHAKYEGLTITLTRCEDGFTVDMSTKMRPENKEDI